MKTLLSAVAVVMLLGAATAAPADAACWVGPGGYWHCWHPYWHHWHHWGWHRGW